MSQYTYKSSFRLFCIVLLVSPIILLSLSHVISAQEKKVETEPDYRIVDIKADHWKLNYGAKNTTLLTGNVVMTQGDAILRSDKVEYDDDTQIATSPGALTITDPENEVKGDSGVAYLKQRRGALNGNVKLIAKPKSQTNPDGKAKEWRDKATITCDSIDYLYKEKQATAAGNLTIVQKDRTITADKGVYLVKQEQVTLTGNVKGRDSKNQTVSAGGKVVVSLKEGDEWMEIEKATGSFRIKVEEEEEPSEAAALKTNE